MKKKLIILLYSILGILLIIAVLFIALPENSFLFRQNPISNQPQLGSEIIKAFKSKNQSNDTVFIATARNYTLECGTGLEYTFSDKIKYKYYLLTHKNTASADIAFNGLYKRLDKIIFTEIRTYINDQIPSDNDTMVFNEKSVDKLESNPRPIFLLNFDVVSKNKVKVSFKDYNRNQTLYHFIFVMENKEWKLNN